jgi:uridine kinase
MKPTLVITMGSTGSGKSKLAKEMIDKLKLDDPKFFLIDDYVENDMKYKQKIKKFSKNKNVRSKLRKPDKKTLKYFDKSYYSVRNNGCKKS